MAPNMPFGSNTSVTVILTGSPDPRQHPSGSGHAVPYPTSYPGRPAEGRSSLPRFPAAFRPPALASRVIRCPPGSWAFLAVGLPEHVTCPDPVGITTFHTHELRPGWVPPVSPGAAVLTRPTKNPRPAPAASQRPAPPPHLPHPIRQGSRITRHQRRFTQFTRPVCPLPVTPGRNRDPSAFPQASHPAVTSDARQGWGQAFEHGPGTTQPAYAGPPICKPTRYVRPRVATSSWYPH